MHTVVKWYKRPGHHYTVRRLRVLSRNRHGELCTSAEDARENAMRTMKSQRAFRSGRGQPTRNGLPDILKNTSVGIGWSFIMIEHGLFSQIMYVSDLHGKSSWTRVTVGSDDPVRCLRAIPWKRVVQLKYGRWRWFRHAVIRLYSRYRSYVSDRRMRMR